MLVVVRAPDQRQSSQATSLVIAECEMERHTIITIPPLPVPCTARPAIKAPGDLADPPIALPTMKIVTAVTMTQRRPNMLANWPYKG
jgi:hypothetical protein